MHNLGIGAVDKLAVLVATVPQGRYEHLAFAEQRIDLIGMVAVDKERIGRCPVRTDKTVAPK